MSGLSVRALRVMHGDREVLRGIDLYVAPGEVCMLMGASGSGKSTTLRAIVALQAFNEGTILVDDVRLVPGRVPPESKLKRLRSKVGMVFQAHALFEHLPAIDNVTLALVHALGWPLTRANSVAHELLRSLGVEARASAYPHQLSGGEAQRIAIARALAPDPKLLLMDEPTSALDPARRASLGDTVRDLATTGRAVLIATHDGEWANRYADRVIELADGVITS
ncbi:MAG TPA: ATP-binding cassette domain-containing protein [Gemmatimonas sp.]|nr:ATP-binding cassette domain-containing protein [Gemmatimonas sp.]